MGVCYKNRIFLEMKKAYANYWKHMGRGVENLIVKYEVGQWYKLKIFESVFKPSFNHTYVKRVSVKHIFSWDGSMWQIYFQKMGVCEECVSRDSFMLHVDIDDDWWGIWIMRHTSICYLPTHFSTTETFRIKFFVMSLDQQTWILPDEYKNKNCKIETYTHLKGRSLIKDNN